MERLFFLDLGVVYAHLTFEELLLATSSLWKLTNPTQHNKIIFRGHGNVIVIMFELWLEALVKIKHKT